MTWTVWVVAIKRPQNPNKVLAPQIEGTLGDKEDSETFSIHLTLILIMTSEPSARACIDGKAKPPGSLGQDSFEQWAVRCAGLTTCQMCWMHG